MINLKTIKLLKQIDWSFDKSSSNGHITALHPYPARFIPMIPKMILEVLDQKKELNILDPFAGCGTTLYEGLDSNNHVYGIDVNALAILLQRVYTYPYSDQELLEFEIFAREIIDIVSTKKMGIDTTFSNIPNLDHWFSHNSQIVLSSVLLHINEANWPEELKDLARFSISRIIVKISNQQSDTQYRALNKDLSVLEIIKIIQNSFKDVIKRLNTNKRNWSKTAQIIQGDSRLSSTYKNINDIDLVITSPPYPNAYEYWLYHKYRMYWLAMDPLWCRKNEIGARPFYSGTGKLNEFDFYEDMSSVFKNLYTVTKADALQFWVVGDSIIKGRLIDNSEIIKEASFKEGWDCIAVIERRLARNKSSFQGIGRQKKENIIILKKKS